LNRGRNIQSKAHHRNLGLPSSELPDDPSRISQ
jgi:hypothetical protein